MRDSSRFINCKKENNVKSTENLFLIFSRSNFKKSGKSLYDDVRLVSDVERVSTVHVDGRKVVCRKTDLVQRR